MVAQVDQRCTACFDRLLATIMSHVSSGEESSSVDDDDSSDEGSMELDIVVENESKPGIERNTATTGATLAATHHGDSAPPATTGDEYNHNDKEENDGDDDGGTCNHNQNTMHSTQHCFACFHRSAVLRLRRTVSACIVWCVETQHLH